LEENGDNLIVDTDLFIRDKIPQGADEGDFPMIKFTVPSLVVAAVLATGAANAQQVVSRTSDYTVTWSGSTFSNASALYAASYAYAAGSPFTDASSLINLLPNAQNFAYFQGGGVTVTSPTPVAPYPATVTPTFSGDGTAGFWGWQYNTAAGPGLPINNGSMGGLATLNFDVGGFDTATYSGIGYYVFVYLPGDWTTAGTATGDHIFNSVASGFSDPTFTYSAGVTTVESFSTTFTGGADGAPNLNFTLIGSAVPEPGTWAMLLLGFAGLGFSTYRGSRKSAAIAL
jgi:hypothetical protein